MKRLIACISLFSLVLASAMAQQATAFADKPALLTSIGQSADLEMVKVLLTRAKIAFTTDAVIMPAGLGTRAKTRVRVVGGSSRGLGAAGISADDEMARAKALIKRARELGMKLIAVHVGGEARRGTLSDVFIELCIPAADFAIVVADADKDGLFTRLAASAKIQLTKVEKISGAGAPLAAAFK